MTGSIPRLLGYVTVGAGVAAAGYVGLVTGTCRWISASAGGCGRSAPRSSRWPPHASWSSTSSPGRTWAGPRGRWPTSCGCWKPAATWCWRPTSPPRGRLGLVAQTVETVRFTRPERVDFRLVRGPIPHVVEAFVLTEQPAGGTLLAYRGEIGADLWAVGQRWCELVAGRWEQTVATSLAAVKAEAERRAAISTARPRSRQPPPAAGR
jgi:hypothetical protein